MFSHALIHNSQEALEKEQEVLTHPTWHGQLVGVDCESLLRGKPTFSYLIREGEMRFHYYFSYVLEAPFTYKHQPFTITQQEFGLRWLYRNYHFWTAEKLETLIPLMIHQPIEKCLPIIKTQT